MEVESSSGIESPSSHDNSYKHAYKVHLFCKRNDTKSYKVGTRSEPPSLTVKNINFLKNLLEERFEFIWCGVWLLIIVMMMK